MQLAFPLFLTFYMNKNKMRKKLSLNLLQLRFAKKIAKLISETGSCIKSLVLNSFQETTSDSIAIESLISFRSKKSNYNDGEWWRKLEKRNTREVE